MYQPRTSILHLLFFIIHSFFVPPLYFSIFFLFCSFRLPLICFLIYLYVFTADANIVRRLHHLVPPMWWILHRCSFRYTFPLFFSLLFSSVLSFPPPSPLLPPCCSLSSLLLLIFPSDSKSFPNFEVPNPYSLFAEACPLLTRHEGGEGKRERKGRGEGVRRRGEEEGPEIDTGGAERETRDGRGESVERRVARGECRGETN